MLCNCTINLKSHELNAHACGTTRQWHLCNYCWQFHSGFQSKDYLKNSFQNYSLFWAMQTHFSFHPQCKIWRNFQFHLHQMHTCTILLLFLDSNWQKPKQYFLQFQTIFGKFQSVGITVRHRPCTGVPAWQVKSEIPSHSCVVNKREDE